MQLCQMTRRFSKATVSRKLRETERLAIAKDIISQTVKVIIIIIISMD